MNQHQPVLLKEVLEGLAIVPSGIYIDGTFGRGGHSLAILQRLGPKGRLLALDKDQEAIECAKREPFVSDPRFKIVHASFTELEAVVRDQGWFEQVDGILLDLGVSSPQLDDAKRGFSFAKEGPLDMRMNQEQGLDAATWINEVAERELADVLKNFGEERFAKRIARAIVQTRVETPIKTTLQLSDIVKKASPVRDLKKHPATRTFQAIRIFINQELNELSGCLSQSVNVLKKGGRLCVISFHSLEDRMVKQFIQREAKGDPLPRHLPIQFTEMSHRLKKIGGLIKSSASEISTNPRARSACLRIAEKL